MFSIVPAGQDFPAIYNGNFDDDNRASVDLPDSGDWAIRVYLMGNDRDSGRTVGFTLDISIAPSAGSAGNGSSPNATLLPEEDLFVVRLSSPGGRLNLRGAPRPSGRLVGTVGDGATVSNVGGCTMSDDQQWCEVQAAGGGPRGWVARFLGLPEPGRSSGWESRVVTIASVPDGDVLNVRSAPGTGNAIVGALSNGTQVRELRCDTQGGSRWCEMEMMTDIWRR